MGTYRHQDPGGLLVGVSGVEPDSPASALLKPGDIITNVNDWEVYYHHDHHDQVHDHDHIHQHVHIHHHVHSRLPKRLADLVSLKWLPVYSGQQATSLLWTLKGTSF